MNLDDFPQQLDYPELAAFIAADPANEAYLSSPEFETRSDALLNRFRSGETIVAGEAARAVGLPFPVFREIFARYLAQQIKAVAALGAEAEQSTKH
jgi:hypothetical protein